MKIVHVEDDHLLAAEIEQEIKKQFPGAQIELIRTESEFRRRLPELVASRPDLFIIDVMLRWADTAPNLPEPPAEVMKEGRFSAGVRCQRLLTEKDSTIPVIFFTVLENSDLEAFRKGSTESTPYLQKSHDYSPILAKVKEIMQRREAEKRN